MGAWTLGTRQLALGTKHFTRPDAFRSSRSPTGLSVDCWLQTAKYQLPRAEYCSQNR